MGCIEDLFRKPKFSYNENESNNRINKMNYKSNQDCNILCVKDGISNEFVENNVQRNSKIDEFNKSNNDIFENENKEVSFSSQKNIINSREDELKFKYKKELSNKNKLKEKENELNEKDNNLKNKENELNGKDIT